VARRASSGPDADPIAPTLFHPPRTYFSPGKGAPISASGLRSHSRFRAARTIEWSPESQVRDCNETVSGDSPTVKPPQMSTPYARAGGPVDFALCSFILFAHVLEIEIPKLLLTLGDVRSGGRTFGVWNFDQKLRHGQVLTFSGRGSD
jgi:hypothetical protein